MWGYVNYIDEARAVEIRLRVNKPLIVTGMEREYIFSGDNLERYIVSARDIAYVIDQVSGYSLYAFGEQLRQGFITINGGHRVGFTGRAVNDTGKITTIKNITYVNIRIAHQVKECSNIVLPFLYCGQKLLNTLIVSPPGCGKTTLLRDLIRNVSDGNNTFEGMNVGVVDERSEIGACYLGIPQNDIGMRTDILDGCSKAEGMVMLLRGMNPKVIAVDEIGDKEDIDAICHVLNSGCTILATAHGDSMEEVRMRPFLRRMIEKRVFERYILLGKSGEIGVIKNIFDERGNDIYSRLLLDANCSVQPA